MTAASPKLARPTNLRDFGAIADGLPSGSAANAAALNKFGVWARSESAAGRAVHVVVPPGTYYFDQTAAADCFKGISTLVFSGHNATFLQTASPAAPWPTSSDTLLYRNKVNPKIAAARKGDTRVTALTPSELAQFRPGEMVMVAGLDIQFNGYPPNFYCFDFVTVRTVDPHSGAMTFDPPLDYDYLSSFPSFGGAWDGSRLYKLDRNGFTWNVDHTFMGIACRHAVEVGNSYISAMGRKVTFRDCDVPGFSESICQDFLAERCVERIHTEPDKLVKRSVRRDGDLRAGLGIQSASVDQISVENCKITLFGVGGKSLSVRNCDIGTIGLGGLLGFCDTATFEDCRIEKAPYFYPYSPTGTRSNYVDGVNVTYARGIFTILKNNLYGLAKGGGLQSWNVVPGQALQFCRGAPGDATQNGSHMASELGGGVVFSVEDRPDAIVIATTLKPVGVPAWSSGQVFVKRRNPPVFRNCTGAEPIRLASDAERAGKNFGEYFHYLFNAKNIVPGITLPGRTGRLVRLSVNVIKPMTGVANAKLSLGEPAAYPANSMTSPRLYQIDIDLTIAGKREFTAMSLRGAVGADQVALGGARQASLPADIWCQDGMPLLFCTGAPFLRNPAAAPIVDLVVEFDLGLLGRHSLLHPGGQDARGRPTPIPG